MINQPWTCPRCLRIWAPTTKGCEACNAAVEVAAIHGFRIEDAEDAAECLEEGLGSPERRLSVVSDTTNSQNAAEYLDRVQDLLRGDNPD